MAVAILSLAVLAPAVSGQTAVEPQSRFDLVMSEKRAKDGSRRSGITGQVGMAPSDSAVEYPQIVAGSLLLPRGFEFNGNEFPTCARRILKVEQDPRECPAGSLLGRGRSRWIEDPVGLSEVDYEFVNGGAHRIWALATIHNPALLRVPIAYDIHRLGGRRWSYRIDFKIPEIMFVIAGVDISILEVDFAVDGIDHVPGYLTFSRRCPKRGHLTYRASLDFIHNDNTVSEASRRGRLRCRIDRSPPSCDPFGCPPEEVRHPARGPTQ